MNLSERLSLVTNDPVPMVEVIRRHLSPHGEEVVVELLKMGIAPADIAVTFDVVAAFFSSPLCGNAREWREVAEYVGMFANATGLGGPSLMLALNITRQAQRLGRMYSLPV